MDLTHLMQLPIVFIPVYAAAFLVALLLIVFIHEYGHYIVARWCGVSVTAFSIGFGKELIGWNDKAGTRWKLCLFPLGGYVKFEGDMNAASLPDGTEVVEDRKPGNFHSKAVWQRALVVVAGPVANFILAIVIFAGLYIFVGVPAMPPRVDEVLKDSAAEKAGIIAGDFVREIDGVKIIYFGDLQTAVVTRAGEELTVIIERNSKLIPLVLIPTTQLVDDGSGGKVRIGLLGVRHEGSKDPVIFAKYSPIEAVAKAADKTWFIVKTTLKYLGKLFTGRENSDQIGGALAIANGAGVAASAGFLQFASFIAFLSVSVGLINLFPVPMLDGGHLFFYALEALRGKPLGPKTQEWSFRIGLSVVVMLMVVGTFNDVLRFIIK
jgi:regulator of sigma E protease